MSEVKDVVVYSSSTWPPCKAVREFLSHHEISFTEHVVDQDAAALEAFKKTGSRGTPTIFVGEEMVLGFDRGKLESLLGIGG